ncbi:hypothetical protein [Rummeliibacillus sp. SL167]|nr:hypothetical protein [Rummeliibacillus sp. SL167]
MEKSAACKSPIGLGGYDVGFSGGAFHFRSFSSVRDEENPY